MKTSKQKQQEQLGMPHGTASHRLRKQLLFKYVKLAGHNYCYRCGAEIESVEELSIEHKTPYLHEQDAKELFFSLDNIAFSHLECNVEAARNRPAAAHGTFRSYRKGCRCEQCTEANKLETRKRRKNARLAKTVKASAFHADIQGFETPT